MKAFRKSSRILVLCLLCVTVFVPIVLLSHRLKHIKSDVSEDFVEDLSIIKHRTDAQTLNVIEQEDEGLKEPPLVLYKDEISDSAANLSYSGDRDAGEVRNAANDAHLSENFATRHDTSESGQKRHKEELAVSVAREDSQKDEAHVNRVVRSRSRVVDEKVKEMKDQVIRAKAYLSFTPSNSSSHVVKELKLRLKEVERVISQPMKDRLSRSSLQKMKAMDAALSKASLMYPDCTAMVKKLRAMTHNAEEQVRSQRNQETFLRRLGGRTIPKGLHCLSMRLTAEYFALDPKEREFHSQNNLQNPHLYHIAVFSNNALACSVVVNSTVSNAKEPERLVFHVVTNSLNLPAISMWFLLNPPNKATIHVESIDSFHWLTTKYNMTTLQRQGTIDPRYASELNHLRFYLPDIFPNLDKIVLLEHDVVVRKDITRLWRNSLRGHVNGALQTCKEGEPSFRRMDMFIDFGDPFVANRFNASACTWAFGLNIFDLREWRQRNLTAVYLKHLHMGDRRPIWSEGSMPIGWLTFYNDTLALDDRWQALGLGRDPSVRQDDINRASVLHFDGIRKPWLDIGFERYKPYWRKYVKFDHPYLQQCNVHD